MIRAAIILAALALLAGCTVVPYATSARACTLMSIAIDEADMPAFWYTEAGTVLEQCGYHDAKERASAKACYASRKNDTSVVCP